MPTTSLRGQPHACRRHGAPSRCRNRERRAVCKIHLTTDLALQPGGGRDQTPQSRRGRSSLLSLPFGITSCRHAKTGKRLVRASRRWEGAFRPPAKARAEGLIGGSIQRMDAFCPGHWASAQASRRHVRVSSAALASSGGASGSGFWAGPLASEGFPWRGLITAYERRAAWAFADGFHRTEWFARFKPPFSTKRRTVSVGLGRLWLGRHPDASVFNRVPWCGGCRAKALRSGTAIPAEVLLVHDQAELAFTLFAEPLQAGLIHLRRSQCFQTEIYRDTPWPGRVIPWAEEQRKTGE